MKALTWGAATVGIGTVEMSNWPFTEEYIFF
jgi:hypothetical protein